MSETRKRLAFPAITDGEALQLLDSNTTDFSIYNRDWPRHGFRWEVRAFYFFERGRGVGQTFGEAAQRALHHMANQRVANTRAGVYPDMKALLT